MGFKHVHLYSQRTMQQVRGKVLECVLKVLRSGMRSNKEEKKGFEISQQCFEGCHIFVM